MRNSAWMLASVATLAFPLATMASDLDDLTRASSQPTWARWQGRLSLGVNNASLRIGPDASAPRVRSASLMGDYYFAPALAGDSLLGGFRATSGVVFGARGLRGVGQANLATGGSFSIASRALDRTSLPNAGDPYGDANTQPYLGFGYTGLSVRNGFSFSADLGLLAHGTGVANGAPASQSLDDAIRQMRMTPLLQFGMSYSF